MYKKLSIKLSKCNIIGMGNRKFSFLRRPNPRVAQQSFLFSGYQSSFH